MSSVTNRIHRDSEVTKPLLSNAGEAQRVLPNFDAQKTLLNIFAHVLYPSVKPGVSSKALNTFFVVSDMTFAWRLASDHITLVATNVIPRLGNTVANTVASHVVQVLNAPNAIAVYNVTGDTTAGNLFIGMLGIKQRIEELAIAELLNDSRGKLLGRVGIVKDALLTAGGACFLALRPLATASAITGASATSLLGRVTAGFGVAGSAVFALFSGVLGAIAALNLHSLYKFEDEFENKTLQGQIDFLNKKVSVDREATRSKLIEKTYGNDEAAFKAAMKEHALKTGAETLVRMMKELGGEKMSKAQARKILIDLDTQEGGNFLIEAGLDLIVQKKEMKKEQKLGRIVGGANLEKIKELKNYRQIPKEMATEIVDQVRASVKTNQKINWALIAMSVGSVLALVGGIIFTGGLGALLISLIAIAYFVVMVGLDVYCYKQDMAQGMPGPHDKKALLIHAVSGIVTLAVVAALMATSVISFGLVPLIVAIVLTVGWVAFDGYSWMRLNEREKKYMEEHPTLEQFLKLLDDKTKKAQFYDVYKKLAFQDQMDIRAILNTNDVLPHLKSPASIAEIKKINQLREDHFQGFVAAIHEHSN